MLLIICCLEAIDWLYAVLILGVLHLFGHSMVRKPSSFSLALWHHVWRRTSVKGVWWILTTLASLSEKTNFDSSLFVVILESFVRYTFVFLFFHFLLFPPYVCLCLFLFLFCFIILFSFFVPFPAPEREPSRLCQCTLFRYIKFPLVKVKLHLSFLWVKSSLCLL